MGFRVNACALVDGIAFEKYASHGLKVPGVVTLLRADVEVTCVGAVGVSAGIFANESLGGTGAVFIAAGVFDSAGCDFVDPLTGADNIGGDILSVATQTTFDFDEDATFICTEKVCAQ